MTFTASKSDDGRSVVVRTTYGPITIDVTEEPSHVRYFWHQLGALLRDIEHGPDAPEPARIAFEAYAKHCGGLSVHGEELPAWENVGPAVQGHWRAALAEPGLF
jgi:hypothetical protein